MTSYRAAITACKTGDPWALGILAERRHEQMAPNASSYKAARSACKKAGAADSESSLQAQIGECACGKAKAAEVLEAAKSFGEARCP